jgi:uncharacterized protein YprB with RNaseH-like and TPR domain
MWSEENKTVEIPHMHAQRVSLVRPEGLNDEPPLKRKRHDEVPKRCRHRDMQRNNTMGRVPSCRSHPRIHDDRRRGDIDKPLGP